MSSEIAIKVDNLSKCYTIYEQPQDRLKQMIAGLLGRLWLGVRKQFFREFWALHNVTFEVKKGQTVGIVGRNGSGKSTLLQLICGTLNPTNGDITTNGRVAALLELGSGFNPEFTGRENVFLNASVLGLTHEETLTKYDEIVAFADIGDFIDQPVRTYSSGMMVRLAFAVIAHVDADILVIDEALAVGDTFFQQKCMRFLRGFQENLGTVLFVSHDTGAVISLCNHAIFLDSGRVVGTGEPESVSKRYLENLYADPLRSVAASSAVNNTGNSILPNNHAANSNPLDVRLLIGDMHPETCYAVSEFRKNAEQFGHGGATIINAGFLNQNNEPSMSIFGGQPVVFFIQAEIHRAIRWPAFGFMLKNYLGEFIFTEGTDRHFRSHELFFQENSDVTVKFRFTMPHLSRGTFLINVALAEGLGEDHIQHCWLHDAVQLDVVTSRLAHGYCGMNDISMEIAVSTAKGDVC